VILGHVDTRRTGAAVFYDLSRVRPGDTVRVTRQDHLVTVFQVDAVGEYPKNNFPTQQVYGSTANAQLRLITCGGAFDRSHGTYEDNVIVFAHLTNVVSDTSNVTKF
jgi:sortase (surface protein transpeptidase)